MAAWLSNFDYHADFDPAGDFSAFLQRVPARWVVYLMADGDNQPVQLLCVKNLRASVKRRLGGQEMIGASRRVNYREIVRRVYWRRVDSAFEADWVYLETARRVFPETYQGMVGFRPAWFVHIDAGAAFPRYTKSTKLAEREGLFIGPVEDKHAAARLIELVEDAFDLCRYYNILVQAPAGKACAYKEMGKCPAPCDGTISMDEYRGMVQRSAEAIVDPGDFIEELTERMRRASAALQFETAGKIKGLLDQVSRLGRGPFRHARRLEDFRFASLQAGPRAGTAKVFLITPAEISEVAGLIGEPGDAGEVAGQIMSRAAEASGRELTIAAVERIGLVSHHLFLAKQTSGVFVPLGSLDEGALCRGWRELQKAGMPEASEEEGVVKELQVM